MGESPGLYRVRDWGAGGHCPGSRHPVPVPLPFTAPGENTHWPSCGLPSLISHQQPSRELAGGSLALTGAFESHRDLCPPHRPSQSTLGVPGAGLEAFHK